MAKPLAVDWDAVRLAYVAGASHSELAQTFGILKGTIAAKCARQNWDQYRQTARGSKSAIVKLDHVTKRPSLVQAGASADQSLDEFSAAMRIRARKWLNTSAESALKDHERINRIWERKADAAEPAEALALTRASDIVDQRARRALGLDSEHTASLNLHLHLNGESRTEQVVDV